MCKGFIKAAKLKATPTQVGLIFSIYSIVQFFASLTYGKFLPVIGARFLYISGYFVTAGSNIIFGFLDHLQPGTQFVVFCAVTRSLEALGSAAVVTAGMSLLINKFPNSVAQVLGTLEIFVGVGMMIGPFIGGILYDAGGYILPFATLGCFMLIHSLALFYILPKDDENILRKCGSYLWLMSLPGSWVGTFTTFVGAATLTFLDPTLSTELEKFDLTPIEVGWVFLLMGAAYSITSPISGWLSNKFDIPRKINIIGCFLTCAGNLVLGSWAPLHIPHTIASVSIGIVLINIAVGCIIPATFHDYLETSAFNGMPDNISTHSVVSGMFNCAYALGAFVGPLLGGALVQNYSFAMSSSVFGFLNFAIAVLIFVFSLWEFNCGKGRRKTVYFTRFQDETEGECKSELLDDEDAV
ncbi:MFS-type transporter SLC18B1-like isoform X2 [Anneissia japonica]|uniref:MFS-type transporter SLC18B1-like isoform X2 n=1 Tax=Anneissia japonica TaxID=1529436 RepID=UPI0014259262|nr:MFS-type transporter SLC18B1-like isoform X2 [Anneissia japonica]